MLGTIPVESLVDTIQLELKMVEGFSEERANVSQTQLNDKPAGVLDGGVQVNGHDEVVNV
jgi:hypothetical protein